MQSVDSVCEQLDAVDPLPQHLFEHSFVACLLTYLVAGDYNPELELLITNEVKDDDLPLAPLGSLLNPSLLRQSFF